VTPTITNTPTITDTPTITPTATITAIDTETPTVTPTPMPTAMEGDVDGDLQADLVFLSGDRRADVILNIPNGAISLRASSSLFAVGIGKAPGDQTSSVITVRRESSSYVWGSLDIVRGSEKNFATIPLKGRPVLGCYFRNELTPSSLVRMKKASEFQAFPSYSNKTSIKVPRTASKAMCGPALSGDSPIIFAVTSKNRKSVSVSGVTRLGRTVLKSPRAPVRFRLKKVALVSQGSEALPSVVILGRRARTQEVYVLSSRNRWRRILVPLDKETKILNVGASRYGGASYIVAQLLDRTTGVIGYYTAPLR
jgi:hypothetical protein